MSALFEVGHSFKRRQRYFVMGHQNGYIDIRGVDRAQEYSTLLGVSNQLPEIYTFSQGVVYVRDLWPAVPIIRSIRPNIPIPLIKLGGGTLHVRTLMYI